MRCNKCGLINSDGATTCSNCGQPLVENGYGMAIPTQNINYSGYGAPAHQAHPTVLDAPNMQQREIRATVMDSTANAAFTPKQTVVGYGGMEQGSANPRSTVLDKGTRTCPHCGYNALPGFDDCPNCGKPMDGSQPQEEISESSTSSKGFQQPPMTTCPKCKTEIPATSKFCPECGEKMEGTIIIGRRHRGDIDKQEAEKTIEPPTPKCSLTALPDDDGEQEQAPQQYEGAEVLLNRQNTEPTNRTITQKEQAVLSFAEGGWYIENRSNSNPTSLIANRKMELQKGDIVVMGDRRFRFDTDDADEQNGTDQNK